MFDNIGRKIKTLAIVVCWIGIIACIITGIVLMATDEDLVLAGILTAGVGPVLSWIGSFVLYGFGQLVENSDIVIPQSNTMPKNNYSSHNASGITHNWRCDSCGNMISESPCPYCNNTKQNVEQKEKLDYWQESVETSIVDSTITCPKCGFQQQSNRACCWKCGVKFIK